MLNSSFISHLAYSTKLLLTMESEVNSMSSLVYHPVKKRSYVEIRSNFLRSSLYGVKSIVLPDDTFMESNPSC